MNPALVPYFNKPLTANDISSIATYYAQLIEEKLPPKFNYFYIVSAHIAKTDKISPRNRLTRSLVKHLTAGGNVILNGYYCFGYCIGDCGGGMAFSLSELATLSAWPSASIKRLFSAELLREPLHNQHPFYVAVDPDKPLSWYGICYKCNNKVCDTCMQPYSVLAQRKRDLDIMPKTVCQSCYDLSFFHLAPIRPSRNELRSFAKQLRAEQPHGRRA